MGLSTKFYSFPIRHFIKKTLNQLSITYLTITILLNLFLTRLITESNIFFSKRVTNNIDNKITGFCIIPYIKNFSSKFATSLSKHNYNIGYRCNNKLNTFIKTNKNPLPHFNKCNVVYEISCNDCNATYVGQTKRQLSTRIKEYRQNIDIDIISINKRTFQSF